MCPVTCKVGLVAASLFSCFDFFMKGLVLICLRGDHKDVSNLHWCSTCSVRTRNRNSCVVIAVEPRIPNCPQQASTAALTGKSTVANPLAIHSFGMFGHRHHNKIPDLQCFCLVDCMEMGFTG